MSDPSLHPSEPVGHPESLVLSEIAQLPESLTLSVPVKPPPCFVCDICNATYTRKLNLKHHKEKKHGIREENNLAKNKCLYLSCPKEFFHKTQLFEHLEKEHGATLDSTCHRFNNIADFHKWKENVEEEQTVFFSKQFKSSKSTSGTISHFICQRDGDGTAHRKVGAKDPKTSRRNKKGRVKDGLLCPARMKVTEAKDGSVTVEYSHTHSHEIVPQDIRHHPLPASEKENIKRKLVIGVPPENVHRQMRDEHGARENRDDDFAVKKKHFFSKRNIAEMNRRLKNDGRLHEDDATSIMLLAEQLKKEKYNPLLLYKPENGETDTGPELPADDLFLFAWMTKQQEAMLKKNASKILCIDATHDTNQYQFKLITLLVPDEFGHGYPVASLITNTEDTSTLEIFFRAIQSRVGSLVTTALMTDDNNAPYNAYVTVFGPVKHLLCRWHVHQSWGRKLSKLFPGNAGLKTEIYHTLVLIMNERVESTLKTYIDAFRNKYSIIYPALLEYVNTYYFNRLQKWCMAYRNFPHGNTDTNMFLESYHNRIKTFYCKRQKLKRIEELIQLLMGIEEDDY